MLLDKARLAVRVKTKEFDEELQDLIDFALRDLNVVGIITEISDDPLITRAVMIYCKANFGKEHPSDYDSLMASYKELKGQLQSTSGYTDWE